MALLVHCPFPGNVCELENVIERAFVVWQRNLIDIRSLPDCAKQHRPGGKLGEGTGALLNNTEAKLIVRTPKKHRGNRTRARSIELLLPRSVCFVLLISQHDTANVLDRESESRPQLFLSVRPPERQAGGRAP